MNALILKTNTHNPIFATFLFISEILLRIYIRNIIRSNFQLPDQ